jgi:hypothetical protein
MAGGVYDQYVKRSEDTDPLIPEPGPGSSQVKTPRPGGKADKYTLIRVSRLGRGKGAGRR